MVGGVTVTTAPGCSDRQCARSRSGRHADACQVGLEGPSGLAGSSRAQHEPDPCGRVSVVDNTDQH